MRKVLKNTYKSSSNCSNNRNIPILLNIKSSSAVYNGMELFHQWRRALGFQNRFCHIIRYDPRSKNVTLKHRRLSRQTSNLLTCRKPNSRRRVWWCQGAPRYNLCKLHSIYFHVNLQMFHNWLVYIYQFGRLSSVSFSLHPPKAENRSGDMVKEMMSFFCGWWGYESGTPEKLNLGASPKSGFDRKRSAHSTMQLYTMQRASTFYSAS